MKCSVVRALSRLGNEADLTTLAADMKDFHEEVVLAFAQALGNGRRGDPAIIAALLRQVPLASAETLCEILKALSKVCSGGDSRATAAVIKIARESEESPVILEALKSLQHMVRRGDEQASGMLLKLLSHSQPLIRGAAAQSLGALGKKGDPTSVCALLRLLRSDEDVSNRVAAIQAVVQLAGVHGNCKRKRSDSTAICALAECMRPDILPDVQEKGTWNLERSTYRHIANPQRVVSLLPLRTFTLKGDQNKNFPLASQSLPLRPGTRCRSCGGRRRRRCRAWRSAGTPWPWPGSSSGWATRPGAACGLGGLGGLQPGRFQGKGWHFFRLKGLVDLFLWVGVGLGWLDLFRW